VPANGALRAEADRTVHSDGALDGDSFQVNYRRDSDDEASDEPPLRLRGDELDLYAELADGSLGRILCGL
jgi:hypothetical protein